MRGSVGTGGETSPVVSFEQIMQVHGEALRALCSRVLADEALAEDVLQQVLLEAHRDFPAFEQRASLRTWLFGIAIHRCQDAIKAKRRYASRVTNDELQIDTFEDPALDPSARLERNRLWEALSGGLAGLSSEARTAIFLRFQRNLSYEEMAGLLGEKSDTLNARVTRAISVLRRDLQRKGWSL